jgi:hypothetical protein
MDRNLTEILDYARKTYPKNIALSNMLDAIGKEYTQDYA